LGLRDAATRSHSEPKRRQASYRRLAQLYHPDHNPGFTEQAAEQFAAITAAYEVLFDALTAGELSE
jgi:DnaJ-class molecular chaperone